MLITYSGGSDDYFLETFGATDPASVTETKTLVTFSDVVSGFYTELSGTSLANRTSGIITGIATETAGGLAVLDATGFSWSANAFSGAIYDLLVDGDFSTMAGLFSLQDVTLDARAARDGVANFHFEGVTSRITFQGSGFDDVLGGGHAGDTLRGGRGADILFGDRGADLVRGGDGADSLAGGLGRDTLDGGRGQDAVFYDLATRGVVVDLAAGTATGDGGDRLIGIEHVIGGAFDDLIRGDDRDNALVGLAGQDTLLGGRGADSVGGAGGADLLLGGRGNDVLRGGGGADDLRGGKGGDSLQGGAGRDLLAGQDGADEIAGGTGNDTATGGAGEDRFIFRGRIDADTVTDFAKGHDTLVLDEALWGGGLARWQVVRDFATDLGSEILFDFDSGETILLQDVWSLKNLHLSMEFA